MSKGNTCDPEELGVIWVPTSLGQEEGGPPLLLLSASAANNGRAKGDQYSRDGVLQIKTESSEESLSPEHSSSPAQVLRRKLAQKGPSSDLLFGLIT